LTAEIYDFEQRIARCRRLIAGLRNGDVALRMLDHLASLGLSAAAISNHAAHLVAVLRLIDFDVGMATRSDVERVVAKINGNKRWRKQTKYHKRVVLRRLIQYAKCGTCERGAPVPPEVSWIKLSKSHKDSRVTPENLLTPEEFNALVSGTENARDKAMLYVLFEGALRPGELLSMSVGSVEFKDTHCLITVNGKTGLKRIPLVVSHKPLLEWLTLHPRRSDPTAPLWCSLATNYKGERLSYRHFRLIIKRLAKNAGLRKAVWPYIFRHTTLTALAKVFTEARLEQYAGWVHGSKMSSRYVHFSARDLEDAVLELHGIKSPEKSVELPKLIACPRCGESNAVGTTRCTECGYVLDKNFATKIEEEEERWREEIMSRIERLEKSIQKLLNAPLQTPSSNPPIA
jgi:integrase/recombinase XerD